MMPPRDFHHQVISLSNASLGLYPQNSLTKFSHRLPSRIVFDPNYSVSVALNTLVLSSTLTLSAAIRSRPSYIKIHLKEVDPGVSPGHSDSQLLARFPFVNGHVVWRRQRVPVFLPLSAGRELTELNYLITDEDNNQLQLESGPPTLIQLDVMATKAARSFSLTLDEEMSRSLHANNTPTTWISELPESIRLDPELEVCLHSVQVPQSVYMQNSYLEITLHRKIHGVEASGSVSHPSDAVHRFKLDRGEKYTESELINRAFKSFLKNRGVNLFLSEKNNGEIRLNTSPMTEAQKEMSGVNTAIDEFYLLRLSPFTARVLRIAHDPEKGAQFFLISGSGGTSLKMRNAVRNYRRKDKVKIPAPDHLALYCDLVEPSIIGNAIAPIVDVLPADKLSVNRNSRGELFVVDNPIFRSINPHVTNTIQVKIRLLDGSEPTIIHHGLEEGQAKRPISLLFVFRKRQ